MNHVINTFNEELFHMINVKVTIIEGKFTVGQYSPFIRATNGTATAHAFVNSISGNQKEINGSFTTDAFDGFTTPFTIQFGIGQEVLGSFENVTTAAIAPLDPLFADVVVPDATNAWLETILIS
jgi:hypothetical protein